MEHLGDVRIEDGELMLKGSPLLPLEEEKQVEEKKAVTRDALRFRLSALTVEQAYVMQKRTKRHASRHASAHNDLLLYIHRAMFRAAVLKAGPDYV